MAPRRKCVFNADLQKEFTFIVGKPNATDVKCAKCQAVFSIENSGKFDIQQHLETAKHKRADISAATSKTISSFYSSTNFDSEKKMRAIIEGTWAYHTVHHNISFRSNDCASKLIKTCFDEKFSCARTKCESIICNVFTSNAIRELQADLSEVHFVSIYSDCSNHGSTKVCPILLRYFTPGKGVNLKIVEVDELNGETSDI